MNFWTENILFLIRIKFVLKIFLFSVLDILLRMRDVCTEKNVID